MREIEELAAKKAYQDLEKKIDDNFIQKGGYMLDPEWTARGKTEEGSSDWL
ncbi:43875_t:CDS:2 [Gigaspora margarita]|uniref:43875_t:CDS:1 n=1 Tax=Gigaspora margarita TaxID=4874 RepID=A0ABN7W1Z9_GIGMA|nr:43875_t:CDS:2 [Gigaspora margarita]